MTFWYGSGLMDADPDPAILVIDLQDANKKQSFPAFYLVRFEGTTAISFFKDKKL